MVLTEQVTALIDFLESHKELALGYCSRTNEGRSLSRRYWMECAQILNSISVDCPNKTAAEWRTFYNEYKSKTLKKIKAQKNEMNATGGGPAKKIFLTPLQERLYTLLGRDVGDPLPGVQHNPLNPTIVLPVQDTPSTSTNYQLESHSFSILDNYEAPEMPNNMATDDMVEIQEISLEQENLVQPCPTDQPSRRRRRRRSERRYAVEDRPDAALEAAQSKLEAIEARNAEAILKQAEATESLAAAISRMSSITEKVVDLIGQFVASVPKKKLRRFLTSSDSESD